MLAEEKQLARIIFKLKVFQSNGLAFEGLFSEVMSYSRSEFLQIRPYGNQGDRGNDGFEKMHGRYFQVYAPQNPTTKIKEAIDKVTSDFREKLIPHWNSLCEIKEYYFAFNDKYQGSTFDIEKALATIKTEYNLNAANVYLAKHLEDECFNLEKDKILIIIGGIPNLQSTTQIEFSILKEVIDHVLNQPPSILKNGNLVVPDIEEKIKFNKLIDCAIWLKLKQHETWQIDDYFSNNSEYAKQLLRDYLAGYYQESLIEFPDSCMDNVGDLRFVSILKKIAPSTNNPVVDRLRQDIALIVMAKYFETCDIFEEPK